MRDQASGGPSIFAIEIAIQNNVTSRHQQTKLPPKIGLNESQGEGSRFNHTKNENQSHYMSTNIS